METLKSRMDLLGVVCCVSIFILPVLFPILLSDFPCCVSLFPPFTHVSFCQYLLTAGARPPKV